MHLYQSTEKNNIMESYNQPGLVEYAIILKKGGWTLRTVGLSNPYL
jgi:hypothetical protein